ncbi:uncharacterized protein LOC127871565 [Dreissena polymorpha]|uniref:uncharacterized protein LOC127871565 n=1 Tax=Dreissena polymorpha TaxID=45954 RepID=UPI0022654B99|nr:uncharacterized protein LOC127871565 [Dreissena polymorpha]
MIVVWMFVAFCEVTKQAVVQGYFTNPFIENTEDLPECGKECLASKLGAAVHLACRVSGSSSTSNVEFQIGKQVRLHALRVGESDTFRASQYVVQDADHLKVVSCDVTQRDGTGSAHATATLYVAKDSTKPVIKIDRNTSKLTCETKGGRPSPELHLQILECPNKTRSRQIESDSLDMSLSEIVEGMILTCCAKSRFFDSKCAAPFAITHEASSTSVPSTTKKSSDTDSPPSGSTSIVSNVSATIAEFTETTPLSTVTQSAPPTNESTHENSYSIMKVVTMAVSSVLGILIVVMIIAGVLRLRKRSASKRINSIQIEDLVSSYHTLSGLSLGVSNYDVVQITAPQRESVHYSEPTFC